MLAGSEVDPEVAQELAVELDEIGQHGPDCGGGGQTVDRVLASTPPAQTDHGRGRPDRPDRPERGAVRARQPPVMDDDEDVRREPADGEPAEGPGPVGSRRQEPGDHSPPNRGGRFSTKAASPSA